MDIAYRPPSVATVHSNDGRHTLLGGERGYSAGANTLYDKSFVYLTSGALASAITVDTGPVACGSGTVVLGFLRGQSASGSRVASATGAVNPPYSMKADDRISAGTLRSAHYPQSVLGVRFAMSVVDGSFNLGSANGAPLLSEITVGSSYGLIIGGSSTPASGTLVGAWAVNVDDTTNTMVRVVDVPLRWQGVAQAGTDSNGIVIVEFLPTKIQTA